MENRDSFQDSGVSPKKDKKNARKLFPCEKKAEKKIEVIFDQDSF